MREDHALAGEVSVEEAREILSRFNSSHFHNHAPGPHGRAVYSIPANPRRDSDIRLGAFIERAARAFAEVARLRSLPVLETCGPCRYLTTNPARPGLYCARKSRPLEGDPVEGRPIAPPGWCPLRAETPAARLVREGTDEEIVQALVDDRIPDRYRPAPGHGIDVCLCGAVLRSCRCMGPHTPRVVSQTCAGCAK